MRALGIRTTLLLLVALVLWTAAGVSQSGYFSGDIAAIKHPLPTLQLLPLEDTHSGSLEDLAGQPFLLNFWASWCVTCQEENKFLNLLSREGIPLAGVALKDSSDDAKRWLNRFGSPFTVSLEDPNGEYAARLGVQGAPETFIIDSEGHVRFHYQGLIQPEVWQQRLKPLLDELQQSQ